MKSKLLKKAVSVILVFSMLMSCIVIHKGAMTAKAQQVEQLKWIVEQKGYTVTFEITSQWDGHFNGNIIVTNVSNKTIHNWNLMFQSNFEIENIWNAKIISGEENYYFINNAEWNQDIEIGASREFGFTAKCEEEVKCPSAYKMVNYLATVSDDDYEISYKVNSDWGSGFTGEIVITNLSKETIEDWRLGFELNSEIENFWSAELIERDGNYYYIQNSGFNANIKAGESITIGIKGGASSENNVFSEASLEQISYKNYLYADNDQDGLPNEDELSIGSDMDKADSDEDGIPDGYEFYELETSPCLLDSDKDGISDADEDFDNDKLINLEEYKNDTDPFEKDTDEDNATDYEEVKELDTNPLEEDTDGDSLLDGDDVTLGFSPVKKDTDEDRILDPNETLYQTLETKIVEEEKKEVTKVSVSFKTANHIKNVAKIENIYNVDMLCTELEGLVGVPVEITSDVKFDEAKIKFYYDENQLGNIAEQDLGVLWYDEENDWFEIQDNVEIDEEKNIVTLTTTHFSKYMLVDAKKWFDVWSEELDYRGNNAYFDIAYAIDTSRSMAKDNRLPTAKKALSSFVDEQNEKDKGALISFSSSVEVVKGLGSTKESIKAAIQGLTISETTGNSIKDGLKKSISQVSAGENKNKIIILVSDGKLKYNEDIVATANKKNVQIYSVNVGDESNGESLQKYADETNGEYYYCPTTEEIETVMATIEKKSVGKIDTTDSDNDGVYDVYERKGIRLNNGQLIKTNTSKKDTDGDGLTDGEEMGAVYTQNNKNPFNRLMKIGKKTKKKVKFFLLYSNPKKRDTDGDTVSDDKDPYPWHGYCGGKHPEIAYIHDCELDESGYYVCKKCTYRFAAPELEDAKILTDADKRKMASLVKLLGYYGIKRYHENETTKLCKTEKLLINKMRKIRRKEKYKNRYSYSDSNGLCKQKRYKVVGSVTIRIKEINLADKLLYSGALTDTIGFVSEYVWPNLSVVWDLITIGRQESLSDMSKYTVEEVAIMALDKLSSITGGKVKTFFKISSILLKAEDAKGIIDSLIQSKVEEGDTEVFVCVDRIKRKTNGGAGRRKINQSWANFVYRGISPIYSEMGANLGGNDVGM